MDKLFYKKGTLLICLLFFSMNAWGEGAFGLNLSTSLDRDVKKEDVTGGDKYTRTTNLDLDIYPSLILAPNSKIEIVPTIGFTLRNLKTVTENPGDSETETTERKIGIGGGIGVFGKILSGRAFRLSLGPDLFFLYFDPKGSQETIDVSLGLPMNVDFLISRKSFLRLGSRLVTVGYAYAKDGSSGHTNSFTIFDIDSMLEARLGLFFRF